MAFKYQGVARDSFYKPYADANIQLRLSIKRLGTTGTLYYTEVHSVRTSPLGIFNLEVGKGVQVFGNMEQVPWNMREISMMVEMSLDSGSSWFILGESQILSVPYALYAGKLAVPASSISDKKNLTRVETELLDEDNTIRFFLNGNQGAGLVRNGQGVVRLELFNSGHNTAIGESSMLRDSTGIQNTALGWNTLANNNIGINNTAVGSQSMLLNKSGHENTALGINSLVLNTTGSRNVGIGANALYNNQEGLQNVGIGKDVLYFQKKGNENVVVGFAGMSEIMNGSNNTALGSNVARDLDQLNNCVFIGYYSSSNKDSIYNSVALGYGSSVNGSNEIKIGNNQIKSIGGYVNWTNFSDSRYKLNVKEDVPGLDFILKLKAVSYQLDLEGLNRKWGGGVSGGEGKQWDENGHSFRKSLEEKAAIRYTGFLAQEVEQVAASVGYDFSGVDKPADGSGYYGLRYGDFTAPMVRAIQEQQVEIQKLKEENLDLLRRLEALESKLSKK